MSEASAPPEPPLFAIGTAVYARRGDEILILKRAAGALTGSWYLPGGALDPGESIERCAARELEEEAGLRPTSALTLVGITPMAVYGRDVLIISYACDASGEVRLSAEHSEARWIRPERYREEFFAEANVRRIEQRDERVGRIVRGIQQDVDRYLALRGRLPPPVA